MTNKTEQEDDEQLDIDEETFERALTALEAAEGTMDELAEEIREIDTGLTHADTVALLYGRANRLNKTEIKDAFDTLDDIRSKDSKTLMKRLLADQSSEVNLKEADAFLDEIERLQTRYGGDGE